MADFPIYQIDAFAERCFEGNPAAVVLLDEWLPDAQLQAIAEENRLSETAFVVRGEGAHELRWFTPETEVDLCGHATLASAHVLFRHGGIEGDSIRFLTAAGDLVVRSRDGLLAMDFPARPGRPVPVPAGLPEALGDTPAECRLARDLLAVFDRQAQIEALEPDFTAIAALDCFAVIATAPGDSCDFVSRFFAPGAGVPEDPVTGSAHCTLVPYWSERLGASELQAKQLSRRGGRLLCTDLGERIEIAGHAVEYLRGRISI